jgi:hypothetical protein
MKWWFFKMLKVVMARGRRLKKSGGDLEVQKQNVDPLQPRIKEQNIVPSKSRPREQNVAPSELKPKQQNVILS